MFIDFVLDSNLRYVQIDDKEMQPQQFHIGMETYIYLFVLNIQYKGSADGLPLKIL